MKNKCCFIILYFGKLPNYFQLFLNSCAFNHDFTWLIFTDDHTAYRYPTNFRVEYIEYDDIKKYMESKFDFPLALNSYHKLCDLKPAFGFLFEDYICDYQFWGHCDIDTIMGNLSHYLTDELLNQYDKLFCLGHFILYRNTFENNRVFMHAVNGELWYKESFTSPETTIFDETYGGKKNVNTIFLNEGKRVFQFDWSMNCHIKPTALVRTKYDAETDTFSREKKKDALYTWRNGAILRYYYHNGELTEEEFMYIHLQSRDMKMQKDVDLHDRFIITENKFSILKEEQIDSSNFKRIPRHSFSLHYIKNQIKWTKAKIKKRLKK